MKTLTILLADSVNQQILVEAKKQKVDAATLCSGVITEHFLPCVKNSLIAHDPPIPMSSPTRAFNVREQFPGFPILSIELTQRFVDESLKLPETRAFKSFSGRGVGVSPNFVFVPYLLKRQPGGIGVSFYGSPNKLNQPCLRPGRNPNYSRTTVHSHDELTPLMALVQRSFELKFGRIR